VNSQLHAEAVRARSHELTRRAQQRQAVRLSNPLPEPRVETPVRFRVSLAWLLPARLRQA
jgi:hypothetical protein